MNYTLNAGEWNSVFAVPSSVVDKYIKLASGGSLKLLLFLMRHGGRIFSEKELREALGFHREGELEDAALFWVQRGIIKAENGNLSASREDEPQQETLPEMEQPEVRKEVSSARRISSDEILYTSTDIAGRIQSDPAIQYLFAEAQKLYGRMIKQQESKSILMLVDHFGLTPEVAVLLLTYCFRIGKTTNGYIQTVAQSWSDDGVHTIEEADKRIAALEKRFEIEEQLRDKMELKTKFSPKQQTFIKTWSEDWKFNADMIMLAYDITLDKTGGMNFNYTNKILENWKSDGINSREAVEQSMAERRKTAKTPQKDKTQSASIAVDDVWDNIMKKYN